jgi:serine/threonine-protein kinase
VGAWFRGDDPGGATAALLYQMETFAEPPHPTFIALSSLDTAGRLRALRARVRDAWLDDKALRELLVRRGAHVTAAREGTVITFPDDAPLRARVIGRELSDALDPSGHRAR